MIEPYDMIAAKDSAISKLSWVETENDAENVLLDFISEIGFPELVSVYKDATLNLQEDPK